MPGVSDVVAIAAGVNHSLALRANGTVVAWGDNSNGQLGDGTTAPHYTPAAVPGLSNVVAIAAGGESGNFNLALLSNGTVVAWGQNNYGQLGDGTINATGCMCITSPMPVSGLSHVVAISAGDYAGMALLRDGTVRDWGYNGKGDLGNGTASTNACGCIPAPVKVTGLSHVVSITHGSYNGIAVLANGTLMDWGRNDAGEIGNGTVDATDKGVPTPKPVSGVSHAVSVADGYEFGFAVLASGRAVGWGYNYDGELGHGATSPTGCECFDTPVAVSGVSTVASIASGGQHSLAVLRSGTAMSWGVNSSGQLGTGSNSTGPCSCVASPSPVDALLGASAAAGGYYHSLALVGPTQKLTVSHAGAGSGTVGTSGIVCGPTCSHAYPQGSFVALRAVPAPGTKFAGFTGACTRTGDCRVLMNADRAVVATFGPPKGSRITNATLNRKNGSASFRFTAPGAITGFDCELIKPKRKNHKRPAAKFSGCSSPKRYKHLKPGKYRFKVRARNVVGPDPKPGKKSFKI